MTPGNQSTYQHNDRTWASLLKISEEAHKATSIENFVATIHDILSKLVVARNFFIGLYDESSDKYSFPYFVDENDHIETTGVARVYDETLETTLYDLSGTLTDYVRKTGTPLRFPNEEINPLYESDEITLFGSQSTSWLGVPLKLSGNVLGVLAVQSYDATDIYTVKDEELLVFVSDHIARAIENVRAEEKSRKQHQMLLQQSLAITDSIRYARRIQRAVLPSQGYIENILPEFFALYKPKDIISGDFYWVREISGYRVIIVADCTGHGVPGALMSMLGITLLNEQFRSFGLREPGVILGHLREKVKEILAQEGSIHSQQDGMDMAIAIIDPAQTELKYSGAVIPLYVVREEGQDDNPDPEADSSIFHEEENLTLFRLKGDKQPIGIHWDEREFSTHTFNLREGDSLYMLTDGFVDQYGGEKRKKYKTRRLKKLLLSMQEQSMEEQKTLFENAYVQWRGNNEQIDDVCVFGLKI